MSFKNKTYTPFLQPKIFILETRSLLIKRQEGKIPLDQEERKRKIFNDKANALG